MLAVDVGNTEVKIGWFTAGAIAAVARLPTRSDLDTTQWHELLRDALGREQIDPHGPVVLGSVVPEVSTPIAAALQQLAGQLPTLARSTGPAPLRVRYDDRSKLGVDRLANAVSAFARCQGAVIVVDLGTATKVECVSQSGEYLGGLIAAGMRMGVDALSAEAAQLPRVTLASPPGPIGTNTIHAIQAAAIFGTAAMIDGLVPRLEREMGTACRVIATGGYTPLIAPHSARIDETDPHLTLDGLRRLGELARAQDP